jgi:ATP-binding cassette subfamily B protein
VVVLAPIPVIALSTWVFGRRVHQLYHRLWRRWAGLSAILADTIPGVRVVKSFAQEERESQRFSNFSADLFNQEMGVVKLGSAFFPFLGLMTGLGSLLIFSIGGYMVIEGATTLGTLMAFTSYMWQFYQPVQRFGELNHRFQHCVTSAERVFEILDSDPEPLLREEGLVLKPLRGKVEFRNVRFSYDPGKYALDGVSFTVEPGEMIGLVGPSGAGKSTLVHLIARFYDVDEGQILIDGQDIQDLALRSYREQIGVVLQEPYLFYGTVWANIAYARPDAAPDEMVEAARAANAHEFIVNLPDGYDTIIGERGQTLSGGERQRISIARAILRNPGILILDEATASVDTETEALIQTALERLVQNRTTFAIAHRLSTLRRASRLIVLERGKLVEIGTHEELVESGGLYGRLCKLQSELSKMRAW